MKSISDHNVYEFRLNNGDIVVADVVETSGEEFVVFDPLEIVRHGTQWLLQKYFHTSTDRWVVFTADVVTAMSRMDDKYVTNYIQVCGNVYGSVEERPEYSVPESVEVH